MTDDKLTANRRKLGDVGTSLLLDNEQVRIWELQLAPGDSSDLHEHANDYVMVQIEGDKIAARFEADSEGTFAGNDYLEGPVTPGMPIFARAGGIETAVNIGDKTFREVVIEIKATSRPGKLHVNHSAITVNSVEASLPFYLDALGLEMLARPDFGIPGAWLRSGNGVEVHLMEDPAFTAPSGPHLAFGSDDLDGELARLRGLGIEVTEPFELNGLRQAFFHDPTGNQFEINQPA